MKLKFPKKIVISDRDWKIKLDKKSEEASFSYSKGEITIGVKNIKAKPVSVFSILIHELKEILQVEQGTRYTIPYTENNYEFHYNHTQHSDFCFRLAGLLNQFIK